MSGSVLPPTAPQDRLQRSASPQMRETRRSDAGSAFFEILSREGVSIQSDERSGAHAAKGKGDQSAAAADPRVSTPNVDARFNAPTQLADHAVSFQARPVVGVAAVDMPHSVTDARQLDARQPDDPARPALVSGENWGGPVRIDLRSITPAPAPALAPSPAVEDKERLQVAAPGSRTTVSPTQQAQPIETSPAASIEPDASISGLIGSNQEDAQLTEASGTRLPPDKQQQGQLFAKMIVSERDYRLLLRDSTLAPGQTRTIRQAIVNLLRSFGLPQMPISISLLRRGK